MLRLADPPALHRVVVRIGSLLLHHLIVQDALGMRPLLPELIFVRFVRSTVMPKLIERPFAAFQLDLPDKLFGGEALQIAQDGGEIGRGDDGVEMIVEDDPRIDGQPFVLAARSTSLRAGPFDAAQGRQSSDRTTMSQHAGETNTGSHSTTVAVTKYPRSDSRAW